jgi:uracil-DNA glycosylase
MRQVKIEASWKDQLAAEFAADYMAELSQFLRDEKAAGKRIYPPNNEIFAAFDMTPFAKVKVVILGQDPYHGPGQAHGLSFSVRPDITPPPSLANIYREMASDLGLARPTHGNLEAWARQGVLLLNTSLTVEDGKPGSHSGKGWERFTDSAIAALNGALDNLVFILWGRKAQQKGAKIDRQCHLVIESAHPSPLAAHNGFWNSRPFSRTNDYLCAHAIPPIDWTL